MPVTVEQENNLIGETTHGKEYSKLDVEVQPGDENDFKYDEVEKEDKENEVVQGRLKKGRNKKIKMHSE